MGRLEQNQVCFRCTMGTLRKPFPVELLWATLDARSRQTSSRRLGYHEGMFQGYVSGYVSGHVPGIPGYVSLKANKTLRS